MAEHVPETPPRPSRRRLVLIVAPIIVIVAVANIANATWSPLLKSHPLWLIAGEPRMRFLLLVANKGVPLLSFVLIATVRRLLSDPLFFLLGHDYGDNAVTWAERRFDANGQFIRRIEKAFRRAAPVVVFFFPGPLVCVLAGATGMSVPLFWFCNVVGTLTVVTFSYYLAGTIKGPLDAINRFNSKYSKWLLVISIVLTVFWLWDQRRKGRGVTLSDAEKQLSGDEPAA